MYKTMSDIGLQRISFCTYLLYAHGYETTKRGKISITNLCEYCETSRNHTNHATLVQSLQNLCESTQIMQICENLYEFLNRYFSFDFPWIQFTLIFNDLFLKSWTLFHIEMCEILVSDMTWISSSNYNSFIFVLFFQYCERTTPLCSHQY